MPMFRSEVVTPQGSLLAVTLFAESQDQVRRLLEDRGYSVVRIVPVGSAAAGSIAGRDASGSGDVAAQQSSASLHGRVSA